MELLLNLAWLLLALPAYWLWRLGEGARTARRLTALQFFLTLACALVLLFPVISATDDVHAMRAEMEDSAVGERAVRPIGADKASGWAHRLQGSPAILPRTNWLPAVEVALFQSCVAYISVLSRPCVLNAGRAPPYSFLG